MERAAPFIKPEKPDFKERATGILAYTDILVKESGINFSATTPKLVHPSIETMRKHYSHILHLPFAQTMIEEFCRRGIIIRGYQGTGIVQALVESIGPTYPSEGKRGQIRNYFSDDRSIRNPNTPKLVENIIHRPSSPEDAKREIENFNNFIDWTTLCTK